VLSSALSGKEIARQLALGGDQEWSAGDPVRPGSATRQRFGGWAIDSRLDRSASAGDHLADLLARASHLADRLSTLIESGQIDSSRVWLHLDNPDVGFAVEPENLRAVAELGSLEVDIYS
jgi:hypothetical protein